MTCTLSKKSIPILFELEKISGGLDKFDGHAVLKYGEWLRTPFYQYNKGSKTTKSEDENGYQIQSQHTAHKAANGKNSLGSTGIIHH